MNPIDDSLTPPLLPGERMLWKGRPGTGLIFRSMDWFLVPFSLLWGGFSLFWNLQVWQTGADLSFQLFGLPFVIAGLYVTVGRFGLDIMLRRRIVYLVTDRRVLIAKTRAGRSVTSLDIKRLPVLELEERSDGTGTMRFGSAGGWFAGNNLGLWQPTFDPTPQFLRIANVRSVYALIQRQMEV